MNRIGRGFTEQEELAHTRTVDARALADITVEYEIVETNENGTITAIPVDTGTVTGADVGSSEIIQAAAASAADPTAEDYIDQIEATNANIPKTPPATPGPTGYCYAPLVDEITIAVGVNGVVKEEYDFFDLIFLKKRIGWNIACF